MLKLFGELFRRKNTPPPLDIEKAVGHYLHTLPRCTNRILVVSRRYLDKRYNYELTVDAASLAAWAKRYETSSWYSSNPNDAAKLALLYWVRGADLSDNSVSFPPKIFFNELRESQETFLNMTSAQAYCYECRQVIADVSKKHTDLPKREIFDCWRSEWFCPQGHLLYKEDSGIHLCVRRKGFSALYSGNSEITDFLRKQNSAEKRR